MSRWLVRTAPRRWRYRTLTKSADRRRSVCSACRESISRWPWQIRSFRSPSVRPLSASSSAFLPVTRHAPICPTFGAARKTERGAAPSPGSFRRATETPPAHDGEEIEIAGADTQVAESGEEYAPGGQRSLQATRHCTAVGRRCAVFANEDIRKKKHSPRLISTRACQ